MKIDFLHFTKYKVFANFSIFNLLKEVKFSLILLRENSND